MSKDTSFLFSGIKFDRKKFAADFSKFKEKKESAVDKNEEMLEDETCASEAEALPVVKKRKRKSKSTSSAPVEGFNVFKASTSEILPKENDSSEVDSEAKKEYHRQMERDALLRKKHNIHISGMNVPSPLQTFAELRSRYKCSSYLVHNLAELGFKEPTPIQRQAIPILLSGRECFACAPTGSGKTLAFVCPMLIKLKHASTDGIRALILLPTRELAAQTARECKKLTRGTKFYIKLMTKQLVKSADFSKLHCDILISTPYRVQYAIRKKKLDLSRPINRTNDNPLESCTRTYHKLFGEW